MKRVVEEEKTKAGLYLPTSGKEKPSEALVVGVGPSVEDIKVGDRVLFGKYVAEEVQVENVTHLVLKQEDIFAIVRE